MSTHARAKEVFLEALDRPAPTRAEFVAAACGNDADLREEVLELLRYHGDRDSRIDRPVGDLAMLEALPERFPPPPPGYRIEALLGRGGMGSVWLAQCESDGAYVAIKMLTAGTHSREMLARFKREAEILRRLSHPGIARLLEAGVYAAPHGDQPFLVLEYVQGEMLTTYAAKQPPVIAERLALLAQIAEAVAHAHANGIVHRDLKPENILVDGTDRVRVLDFGVARFVDADHGTLATRTGMLLGTPQYMSPEQVQADPRGIGPACDVYALGVLGFELLGGRLPYDVRGQSLHRAVVTVLTVEPPRLGTLGDGMRGDVENIIAKALEKRPQDRYADAGAMLDDVRRHIEGRPVSVRAPSPLRRAWREVRSRRWLVPASLVALAIAAVLAVPAVHVLGDAAWRTLFGGMLHADDLVHDEKHRDLASLEQARQQLLKCRAALPSLPERPYRRITQVFLTARLGEAHWILGDLRGDPAEFELALPEFLHARGGYPGPLDYAAMGCPQDVRERYEALTASDLDGLVCMAYRELARYRRPAENYLLACNGSDEAAGDLLARFGLTPPPAGAANANSAIGWPEMITRRTEYVYFCNDFAAAQTGYARAAENLRSAEAGLRLARDARRYVHQIAGADPGVGSVFEDVGNAFFVHARLARLPAELDSAQTQYQMSLAYRGPERPHQFAETQRALAEVDLARARFRSDDRARVADANAALARIETARRSLRAQRVTLATEYAWLDLIEVQALLLRADASPGSTLPQECLARLAEAAAAFPSTSDSVHGSWNALLHGRYDRLRWQRTGAEGARTAALEQFGIAASLAASQDREMDRLIREERARLALRH